MSRRRAYAVLVIGVAAQMLPAAGGPLQIDTGSAIVWNTSSAISYKIDKGPLGKIAEPQAQEFAEQAFETWGRVPTANLKFQPGRLDEDVQTAERYLALSRLPSAGSILVLDNEGDIVQDIYGFGQEEHILGFASPKVSNNRLSRFVALMNGFLTDDQATVRSTMVHEFGHALGLDHTQVNAHLAKNDNPADDEYVPTMFPTSADDDTTLVDLNPDDMAAISRLYPNAEYSKTYGIIRGRLIRRNKTAVLGANVVASAFAGNKEDPMRRFSCVSDYLLTSDGMFEIVVTPGTYKLLAEPIREGFAGGSSVGPHAETSSSPSFRNRIRTTRFPRAHTVKAGETIDVGDLVAQ